ncbi:MAG: FtsX-like permease family protein, partial [Actinomycetota bacterium]
MLRTAIKTVLAHKVRLMLTAVAIVLGVGLVAGTFMFTDTINGQFDTLLDDIYAGTDVSVRSEAGEFSAATEPFPESVYDDVLAVEGVKYAEPGVGSVSLQVLDGNGDLIKTTGAPTLGFSWGEFPSLNPMRVKDGNGRAPEGPGEMVIDANTATNAELSVGETITVVSLEGPEEYELVGIVSFGDSDSLLGAILVAFELEEAQRLFGYEDELTGILVQADDGVDAEALVVGIGNVLPEGVEAVTGETEQGEQSSEISEALGFVSIGLLAFAGVSVFVGAFIIQNTFRIIIAQRTRELALLRAIGATGRQVRWMVIVEALIVGLVGSILGIAFGAVMSGAITALMNAAGTGIPTGSMVLLPRTIIVGLTVGLVLTLLSALLPARKASRIPPVAAMREDAARAPRRSLQIRGIAGAIITGLGVALLLIGLFASVGSALAFVGAGAAIAFIGVSTLAPLAARPLADVIGWPLPRLFGVSGKLAKENTKRKPRRTASTASALMVGVALVVFFTVFASSTKASIEESIFDLFPADLTFQASNQTDPNVPAVMSPAFSEELRGLDEFETVSAMQFGLAVVDGDEELVGAVDPATIEEVVAVTMIEGSVSDLETRNTIVLSEAFIETLGRSIGDTIAVEYASMGEVDTVIVGTFEEATLGNVIQGTDTYMENFRYVGDSIVFANTADGVTIDEAMEVTGPTVQSYGNVKAQTKSDIVTEAEAQIDGALVFFTAMLLFAVLIAVLGITNTLTLSVYERTKEIGLLRAVGMGRRQVRRMIRWEAVIVATFGALMGAAVGIVLGWATVQALADQGLGSFRIPFDQVLLALVLAAVAGVLAAIWPARKAARMNVLEAIT